MLTTIYMLLTATARMTPSIIQSSLFFVLEHYGQAHMGLYFNVQLLKYINKRWLGILR